MITLMFRRPRVPVSRVLDAFLASRRERGLRPVTLDNYRSWAVAILPKLGERAISEVQMEELAALRDSLSNIWWEYTHCMLRWAVRERYLLTNPLPPRPAKPLGDHQQIAYLTPVEAQRFWAAVPEEARAAFALAMYGGLRPYEVCRMRWEAISIAERRIRIEASVSKTRTPRIIEDAGERRLPTILWAQLGLRYERTGWVLPRMERCGASVLAEDRLMYWSWQGYRKRAMQLSGVELAPDVLRHTFATYFVALTGDPFFVAKILGHRDLAQLIRHYDGVATRQDAEEYVHPKPILALQDKKA